MRRTNRELWLALLAIALIAAAYLFVTLLEGSIPAAREFFGHSLGILGFTLMVLTETLYSLRKRSRNVRWGRTSHWLQFHIFTGLVGPFLVLLHSSWKFNGLAGVLSLLTLMIVISGFTGRYIYTAVPRTVDGIAIEARVLQAEIDRTEGALEHLLRDPASGINTAGLRVSHSPGYSHKGLGLLFTRVLDDLRVQYHWWWALRRMDPAARSQATQLVHLLQRRRVLQRQVASLSVARRALALWHAVHIPLGMILFTFACVHITAALYYATLMK